MLRIAKRQDRSALSYHAWCDETDKNRSRHIREERLLRKQAEIEARVQRELREKSRKGVSFASWFEEKQEILRYLRQQHKKMMRERMLAKQEEELRRRAGLDVAIAKWLARERKKEMEKRSREREILENKKKSEEERRERGEQAFSEWLYDYHEQLQRDRMEKNKKLAQSQKEFMANLQVRQQKNDQEYQDWLIRKKQEGINPSVASSRTQIIGADEEEKYHVTRAGPHTFGYGNRSDLRDFDPRIIATKSHAEQRKGLYVSHTPFYDLRKDVEPAKSSYMQGTISSSVKKASTPGTDKRSDRSDTGRKIAMTSPSKKTPPKR